MKRILVVADDPNMQQNIRKMLLPLQEQCETVYVNSGENALQAMSKGVCDVIIVDIQNPLNGVELLNKARLYFPKMVRIIISNQSSMETIRRAAGLAHQFISKPFSAETLLSSITRALSLSNLLDDEKIRKLVLGIQSLPSLPSLYMEIVEELQRSDPSSDKVGEIIARDMSMSVKVLQLVNSAFFGFTRHVSSPSQAAVILGLETIRDLVLSLQIFSQFDDNKLRRLGLSTLWDHSVTVGLYSKTIAKTISSDREFINTTFLAGMLHDLGKLVLAENFTIKYYSAIEIAQRNKVDLNETELEIFGTTHAQLGAYLMGVWGLADQVVDATAYHHTPEKSSGSQKSIAFIIHVANVFDHEHHPNRIKGMMTGLDLDYIARYGLGDKVEQWRQRCVERSA